MKNKLKDSISVFRGIDPTPAGKTEWMTVLDDIKSDKYKSVISKAQSIKDPDEYREYKKKLPSASFCAEFKYRNTDTANIITTTGFIIPDIDHMDNVETVFPILKADKNVWFAFRSPSGKGIKCGIRSTGIQNDDDLKKLYYAVEWYFEDIYGINIDQSCKDISRLTFVSHDPDLFINSDPAYFDIGHWQRPEKEEEYTRPSVEGDDRIGYHGHYRSFNA